MRFFIIPKRMFENKEDAGKREAKTSGKRWFFAVIFLVMFAAAFVFVFRLENNAPKKALLKGVGEVSLAAATEQERAAFFEQLGYNVQECEKQEITIPCTDGQFSEYNELQKSQGFDLSPLCGRKATMYTMKILGEEQGFDELFGVIIVYKGRAVAGHITDNLYPACVKPLVSV